jgi:hypothetical protein
MTSSAKQKSYALQFEEKATPLMVYTHNAMVWGDLVTKELVRVSTWLRTPTAPSYLCLYDCQLLYTSGPAAPASCRELHIPTHEVLAYHMLPPQQDPPDYDPNEPNRKHEPVTVLTGDFRLQARLRISTMSTLLKHLEVINEKYTSLYEVTITQPLRPNLKGLQVPFVLVLREAALFAVGDVA